MFYTPDAACRYLPLVTRSNASQVFSLEIGLHSRMRTTSPVLNSPFSSWAWYFFDRRTVLPITGWVKRRSTFTTTVLAFLSLTTTPCSTRFGIPSFLTLCFGRGRRFRALLGHDRFDPGDLLAHGADAAGVLE